MAAFLVREAASADRRVTTEFNVISRSFKMPSSFRDVLETFDNPFPQRDYSIETVCPEFTSLCPKTGQPDFGTLTITYVPDRRCYELKSLKLYLQQYRNHGAFYEAVTNTILDDLVAVTQPRSMKIVGAFTPRGGIRTNVTVDYKKEAQG
jgi:7-cyano-7-deazaguanine reductase